MSSNARYVSGDCKPIAVKCDPNYPIEVGDLLFLEPSNNLARPASAMINQGSLVLNQGALHDVFLGVALQKNGLQTGEVVPLNSTLNHSPANTIEAATAGRFLYPCAATAWNPGAWWARSTTPAVRPCRTRTWAPWPARGSPSAARPRQPMKSAFRSRR